MLIGCKCGLETGPTCDVYALGLTNIWDEEPGLCRELIFGREIASRTKLGRMPGGMLGASSDQEDRTAVDTFCLCVCCEKTLAFEATRSAHLKALLHQSWLLLALVVAATFL